MLQEWLNNINVKYYESKINLNWKPIQKNIMDVRPLRPLGIFLLLELGCCPALQFICRTPRLGCSVSPHKALVLTAEKHLQLCEQAPALLSQ